MKNKKGFAISGIVYSLLLIFLVLMINSLNNLQNKKQVLDQLKLDTVNAIDQPWQVELANLQNQINTVKNNQYPVGSIYMTTDNVNPSNKFGGTWIAWGNGNVPIGVDSSNSNINTSEKKVGVKQYNSGDDSIFVGSQVIYDNVVLNTAETKTLITSYSESLLYGIFNNVTQPKGYKKAYRISAQISTENDNQAKLLINGVELISGNTWSSDRFRIISSSQYFFDWLSFPSQNSDGYSKKGLNLQVQNTGAYEARVYNITLQAYFVKDSSQVQVDNQYPFITCYMWKRTA